VVREAEATHARDEELPGQKESVAENIVLCLNEWRLSSDAYKMWRSGWHGMKHTFEKRWGWN
jgi:hypothetical protein